MRLVPVNDEVMDYARQLESTLRNEFIRADIDTSHESFNKKIRNAVTRKIPNIWVLGKQELEGRSVTWRRYAVKEQQTVPFDKAFDALKIMRDKRIMDNFADVNLPI